MSHNLCVIPARGGSKRIPRKNVKEFCGWPIINYPTNQVIASNLFSNNIIVSSDDREILSFARHYNLNTFRRSEKTASDTATLTEVINEVIDYLKTTSELPDCICCILPTAVFVTKEDLINSYKLLSGNDSVVSVVKYNHPIERAFGINTDGQLTMMWPKYEFSRTQDLLPSYHDAGQFYWLNVESFIKQQKIFMDKSAGYQIDAIDIDNEGDWQLAELKYKLKKGLT
jgi:N-acylneuraminate cytidylyltransferase